jgi:hypothetical protein
MTCTEPAYDPRVKEIETREEKRGRFGDWERGPHTAGTTRTYCTVYSLGNSEIQAGNCITVTWRRAEPPRITSFKADGCSAPGPCPQRRSYTVSWHADYAESCTLNGISFSGPDGSIRDGVPEDQCADDAFCRDVYGYEFKCVGVAEDETYTLTCTNSAGSDTKTLTVEERWNECRTTGGPKW